MNDTTIIFPAAETATPAAIIANALILRGGPIEWARDAAETALDALEVAGFRIVSAQPPVGNLDLAG